MLTDTINSQELYCHLDDFRFKHPMSDQWESFKGAINIWCDCWFGQEPRFELRGDDCLYVMLEGIPTLIDGEGYGVLCIFDYHPEGYKDDKFAMPSNTIEIRFFDEIEGQWEGDHYNLTFV